MVKFTNKPSELRQAQVAAFTGEAVKNWQNRHHIFRQLGELANSPAASIRWPNEVERDQYDIENVQPDQYSDFMKTALQGDRETFKKRAEILANYAEFAPVIDALRLSIGSSAEDSIRLGSGGTSGVFRTEHQGKAYAVRIPKYERGSAQAVDQHIAAAVLTKGLPHFEQVVAASYDQGITVSEIMPGIPVNELDTNDILAITDRQLQELLDTIRVANQVGVVFDSNPANFLYDKEAGFGVVDVHSAKDRGSWQFRDMGVGELAGRMAQNIQFYLEKNNEERDVDQKRAFEAAQADLAKRYLELLKKDLSLDEFRVAELFLEPPFSYGFPEEFFEEES